MILPLIVITVYASLGLVTAWWLYRVGSRPWSWQRPLRSPKIVAEPYYPTDYSVGHV